MADLKPTMDYKVRLKVKKQDLAVRKVEGEIAVKKYNKSLLKKINHLQSCRRKAVLHLEYERSRVQ